MIVWAENDLRPSISFQTSPLTIKSLNIYLPSRPVENVMFTNCFIESLKTGFFEK